VTDRIRELEEAVRVLAEEVAARRALQIAMHDALPKDFSYINGTTAQSILTARAINATNANPIARAAAERAQGGRR
jgi:hypothetical protein